MNADGGPGPPQPYWILLAWISPNRLPALVGLDQPASSLRGLRHTIVEPGTTELGIEQHRALARPWPGSMHLPGAQPYQGSVAKGPEPTCSRAGRAGALGACYLMTQRAGRHRSVGRGGPFGRKKSEENRELVSGTSLRTPLRRRETRRAGVRIRAQHAQLFGFGFPAHPFGFGLGSGGSGERRK